MVQLSKHQATAIMSLMHGAQKEDFKIFVEYIAQLGEESNLNLINSPDQNLKGLQGQTQAYTRILEDISNAQKVVNSPKPT